MAHEMLLITDYEGATGQCALGDFARPSTLLAGA